MRKNLVIIAPGAIGTIVLILAAILFFASNYQKAAALENVLEPARYETLIDFDCSSPPCRILGPRKNDVGAELRRLEYAVSIIDNKFNNLSTISIVVNKGDILTINAVDQDLPQYYLFIPATYTSHTFIKDLDTSFFLDTGNFRRGDYVIMLQDLLDPALATTNFQAAILRVK